MSFIFPDTEDSILLHHICSHQQNNPCYDQSDINQPRCHHFFVFKRIFAKYSGESPQKATRIVSAVPLTISFRSSLSESCSLDTLLPNLSLPILIFDHHFNDFFIRLTHTFFSELINICKCSIVRLRNTNKS